MLFRSIDELVGGEDEGMSDKKKRKAEADDWLEAKRKKARQGKGKVVKGGEDEEEDEDEDTHDEDMMDMDDFDSEEESGLSLGSDAFDDDDESMGSGADEGIDDEFGGFDSEESEEGEKLEVKVRENPYVAPVVARATAPAKYIPPSMRKSATSDDEHLLRLRRQDRKSVV